MLLIKLLLLQHSAKKLITDGISAVISMKNPMHAPTEHSYTQAVNEKTLS